MLEECSFLSIKSQYKWLKQIGLLFSSATPTHIDVPDCRVVETPNIEMSDGNFTDGCGAVSQALAEWLRENCRLVNESYHLSVFRSIIKIVKEWWWLIQKINEQLVIWPSLKSSCREQSCLESYGSVIILVHIHLVISIFSLSLFCQALELKMKFKFLCIQTKHIETLQLNPEAACIWNVAAGSI